MSLRVTLLLNILILVIHTCICNLNGLPPEVQKTAELIQVYTDGTRVFRYITENNEARYVYVTNDKNGYPIKVKYSQYLNVPGKIVSTPIDFQVPGGAKFTTKYVNPFAGFSQSKFEPM